MLEFTEKLGIFTARDPFGGTMAHSASRNGYSYVHGNPVNDAVGELTLQSRTAEKRHKTVLK